MGSLISSRRIYQTSSKSGGRKCRGRSRSPDLRSSINRPVLRLQVKADTLSRQGIQTSNGVSEFRRSTLRKLAHSGVPYEKLLSPPVVNGCRTHTPPPLLRHNLNPPTSLPPHTLPTPSLPLRQLPRRSHSVDALDSMVIIQYVENDRVSSSGDVTTDRSDGHLAKLSYARMGEVQREEEHFGNITINRNGSPPVIAPSTSLGMINVCQRIQDHTQLPRDHTHSAEQVGHAPLTSETREGTEEIGSRSLTPDDDAVMSRFSHFRRSRSTDALSGFHSSKGWKQIQSVSEDEVSGGMEWSLGESIMRAMSQHRASLFNIENPTSASEHEVNRAWPQLKDKMRVWKSQHSLDRLESSSEDTVFRPHQNTSITITAH